MSKVDVGEFVDCCEMQSWHGGMGTDVYSASSCGLAGIAVPASTIRGAISELEKSASENKGFIAKDAAKRKDMLTECWCEIEKVQVAVKSGDKAGADRLRDEIDELLTDLDKLDKSIEDQQAALDTLREQILPGLATAYREAGGDEAADAEDDEEAA